MGYDAAQDIIQRTIIRLHRSGRLVTSELLHYRLWREKQDWVAAQQRQGQRQLSIDTRIGMDEGEPLYLSDVLAAPDTVEGWVELWDAVAADPVAVGRAIMTPSRNLRRNSRKKLTKTARKNSV